jgi:hypothetical protein
LSETEADHVPSPVPALAGHGESSLDATEVLRTTVNLFADSECESERTKLEVTRAELPEVRVLVSFFV